MKLIDLLALVSLGYSAVTLFVYTHFAPGIGHNEQHMMFTMSMSVRQFLVEARDAVRHTAKSGDCSSMSARRFPKFGTDEFDRRCSWTTSSAPLPTPAKDCTILVRPDPIKNNEGISWWVSEITEGLLTSKLIGCRLLLSYGPDVNLGEVLMSPSSDDDDPNRPAKWEVPPDFDCSIENKCFLVDRPSYKTEERIAELREEFAKAFGEGIGREMVRIPQYRFAYFALISVMTKWKIFDDAYGDLQRAIPDFDLQTGYSCALGSLFRLAPTASQFEPDLFTKILPTLNDERNLVITLYIRTNYADDSAKAEKEGRTFDIDATKHRRNAQRVIDCALAREEEYLSKGGTGTNSTTTTIEFTRIVWMLVSDSAVLKRLIADEYHGNDTNANLPLNQQRWESRVIPREIITTGARGTHTRAKRRTTTEDFAEALIDWWLIGESDVVLSSGSMSFGETGALRTQRPLYLFTDRGGCERMDLVHDRSAHVESNYTGPMMWFPK